MNKRRDEGAATRTYVLILHVFVASKWLIWHKGHGIGWRSRVGNRKRTAKGCPRDTARAESHLLATIREGIAMTNSFTPVSDFTPITNDQMFKHVFGQNKELCRRLIELSLETPIRSIEFVESQHESKDPGRVGGGYLDVLATTSEGELIDVEMQTQSQSGLPQRIRLYLGLLTRDVWSRFVANEHAYDFAKMPRVAVIFVCDFDPFKGGLRRYTGRMIYRGASTEVDDGMTAVILNSGGSGDAIDPELAAFLDYVAGREVEPGRSSFVDGVGRAVASANEDARFKEGLMNLDEKLWISKEEGRAEGFSEGSDARQRQISELARRMAADGRQDDLVDVITDAHRLNDELRRYGIE